MNMALNPNIPKVFRKQLDVVSKWKKNKNHAVTYIKEVKKTAEGQSDKVVWAREKSNAVWGRPQGFSMKS
jgi:hypothetical protein